MKIKVSAIKPNPFRHIEKYPILEEKVEALKTSIEETEFWDNIVVRRASDGDNLVYELAYGHHRLEALRALGRKEIDIPVKDIDDAMMLKIMANENMDSWKSNPAVIMETVSAAKEFIDSKLSKADSFDALNGNIKGLTDEEHFHQLKSKGAGQKTILKFLGANWKQWMIQDALSILRNVENKEVSEKAVQKFDNLPAAKAFREGAVRENIPVEEQEEIAEKLIKDGDSSYQRVSKHFDDKKAERVEAERVAEGKKNKGNEKAKGLKSIEDFSFDLDGNLLSALNKAHGLEGYADYIPIKLKESMIQSLKKMLRILESGKTSKDIAGFIALEEGKENVK